MKENMISLEESGIELIKTADKVTHIKFEGRLFDKYDLLAGAITLSKKGNDRQSWDLIELSRLFFDVREDVTFKTLTIATINTITNNNYDTEFKIHNLFDTSLPMLFNNEAIIVNMKSNRHHIPDRWISLNENIIPVEIKLKDFNFNAFKQLNRYMNFYKCSNGIAVGEKLTTLLPNNIRFISIEEIKKNNKV